MKAHRIVHHSKAYAELIKLAKVQEDLNRRARAIAGAAGGSAEGFVVTEPGPRRRRARASILATRGDPDNKLIRALDAGRS